MLLVTSNCDIKVTSSIELAGVIVLERGLTVARWEAKIKAYTV